jgi:hypothetical protein
MDLVIFEDSIKYDLGIKIVQEVETQDQGLSEPA